MHWILRVIGILIVLAVLVAGVEFFAVNSHPVTVHYFLDKVDWPLSLVVVCAFSLGVLLTVIFTLTFLLPLRWRLSRLQHTVSSQEHQLETLRKPPDQGARRS